MQPSEIADVIRSFVDGSAGERDWDDFTSIRQKDPDIEEIRQKIIAIPKDYPPTEKGHWCSEEGRRLLLEIASTLSAS